MNKNGEISFSEFSQNFEEEAKILTDYQQLAVNFLVEENKLLLASEKFNPICVEIEKSLDYHEKYFYKNSFYKDPLARAIGLKKGKERPVVLDSTAGLMGDGLLMYAYGLKHLICMERNPVVAALIVNALSLVNLDIEFHFGDLQNNPIEQDIDVVFYDPMYKEKNLKSAPRKEMAIFRELIGEDTDSLEMATFLRTIPTERLVIKRPAKASPLLDSPNHTIKGKSTCYDVYLTK